KAVIEYAENETVKAQVTLEGQTYEVLIKQNEERNFDTSCSYEDTEHPLCLPKVIVFLQLLNTYGANYFDSIRNWDKEKNKLLEAYGYSLKDDLKGKFEFTYQEGKPFLRVLDTSIKRTTITAPIARPALRSFPELTTIVPEVPAAAAVVFPAQRLGVVFNFNKKSFPRFSVDAVIGEPNEANDGLVGTVEKLDIARFVNTDTFSATDAALLQVVRKLQDNEINKYVNRNSPFSGIWENILHHEADDLPEETKDLITEYLQPKLHRLFQEFGAQALVYTLAAGKVFKTANLEPLHLQADEARPLLLVKKNSHYTLSCKVKAGIAELDLTDNEAPTSLLFFYNHQAFCWKNKETILLVEQFRPAGKRIIQAGQWKQTLQEEILPLSREHTVQFDRSLTKEISNTPPEPRVALSEKGDYLVFTPRFLYQSYEAGFKDGQRVLVPQGDGVLIIQRQVEKENAFLQKLQSLHSGFVYNKEDGTLALKGPDVLRNNWFFLFIDAMKEAKTPVFGFELLKHYRFNTAKPQTRIFISSHTDWFDAKVNIVFGDQQVTVADVKKALASKQPYVQLGDGSLGVLPEEWLKKYALLFRVGEGKTDTLKLSRYHLGVVDELYTNRQAEDLELQLEEKYEQLRRFDKIESIELKGPLTNVLRPYQVAGYQWLNYLRGINWGGILADDMGLGKTVQALSFLEYYKRTEGKLKALVVCPTTLIYNWENEIKKFTPSLSFCIHHGAARTRKKEQLEDHDITITTYGTLRSDIKLLSTIALDYAILDESQAIKNPSSKV
ncbi:MAG: DEAD/DEAH box helicase, partial [Sphingomonadales bacterium]